VIANGTSGSTTTEYAISHLAAFGVLFVGKPRPSFRPTFGSVATASPANRT
jgi:hypothetical protein